MLSPLLVSLTLASFWPAGVHTRRALSSSARTARRVTALNCQEGTPSHEQWVEKLMLELDDAAELAKRGGTISDVLKKASAAAAEGAQAAKDANARMAAKLQAAEARAATALQERDAAMARVDAAEAARMQASEALEETERQLAEAEERLEQQRREAGEAMGELDEAFEFEQDRVAAMRQALEETKKALKKAQKESELARAREASATAATSAVEREKTEVELRLEEERQLLEGCLVDARSDNEALLCRALVAEQRIGRKRRAVRKFMDEAPSRIRKFTSRLRDIKLDLPQGARPSSARTALFRVSRRGRTTSK